MGITEELARFINNLHYEGIPESAIKTAKEGIFDCVSCILIGSVSPAGRMVAELVKEESAMPRATVIGHGFKTSKILAALANGVMAHAEDYDDINLVLGGHPSPPIVPAILALAEEYRLSGREIIESYVVGFEVETRMGKGINMHHYNKGWHATATLGIMGAAAACAKLLKLNEWQIRMALGIAASQASGIRQNFGTMTKPFHAGHAAKGGLLAALLAKKGFTADPNIVEAELGFLNVLGDSSQNRPDKIIEGLDENLEICNSGIAFKLYPSCAETHPGIEIILQMSREFSFDLESIESIECIFNNTMNSIMLHSSPKTGLEGKFSIEYCIARALIDRKVQLDSFTDKAVHQAEIKEIMKRIKRTIDPALPIMSTAINIKLKNGRVFTKRIDRPRGYPENPLEPAERIEKYIHCASGILSSEDIERSINIFERLEEVEDVAVLMNILGGMG